MSYTFSPGQAGAGTFPRVAATPPVEAVENYSLMSHGISTPYPNAPNATFEQDTAAGDPRSIQLAARISF